jgi:RHS repeat-associated protein
MELISHLRRFQSRPISNYFRDYDPQTGRYCQSDPIGLRSGVNTYGYVLGNPVSKIDPYGLFPMYGNWGGSNYSGGVSTSTIPFYQYAPIDAFDDCYMRHDYCYAGVANSSPTKGNASSCPARSSPKPSDCDAALATCISHARDAGNQPATIWGYLFVPASQAWARTDALFNKLFGK